MVTLSFDNPSQIITVMAPDTEITIQELHNKIREYEDDLDNHSYGIICDTSGKEQLLGGVQVGLTMVLYDWKIKFESRAGPAYTQCAISGGNVVGYDTGTSTYGSPLEPSDYVYAVITSSSSATLQELDAVQFSSFDRGVTIDVTSSYTGTEFPVGTLQAPVNNLADALTIATERGLNNLYIIGPFTFNNTDDISNYTLTGNHVATTFTLNTPVCLNTEFCRATLTGTLNGGDQRILKCEIENLTNFSGVIRDSILRGDIVLDGTNTVDILNCFSGVAGTGTPEIDMGGSGRNLAMRAYSGGIKITNLSGAENVSIDLLSGQLKIGADVTAGTFVVRGTGVISENLSTGTTIVDTGLINPGVVWDEQLTDHEESGSAGEALGTLKGRKTIPSP